MEKETTNIQKIGNCLLKGGLLLVALSLFFLFLIFYPIIRSEIKFILSSKEENGEIVFRNILTKDDGQEVIVPADENFSLIIPKIGANERIIAEVDPFNEEEYSLALKEGIAHAKGSGLPGQEGNVFLFAHSSGNFYDNSRLNTIFFLLNKLETGDHFSVIFQGKVYEYEVYDKKIVSAEEIEYMESKMGEKKATLMTCWPPGTSYRRLLVLGKMIQ